MYLNEFHRDFEGGRFIFIDENKVENRTTYSSIEPKKGRVSVFTSGAENVHHIEKVTQGIRYDNSRIEFVDIFKNLLIIFILLDTQ